MTILYVDDKASEYQLLVVQLKTIPGNHQVEWMPTLSDALELLSCKIKKYDLLIIDVVGTSMDADRTLEAKIPEGQNYIYTSQVVTPNKHLPFCLKEDLVTAIQQFVLEDLMKSQSTEKASK